jgi:hypothetical protein
MRFTRLALIAGFATASAAGAESSNQWYLRGVDGGYAYRVAIDQVSHRPLAGGLTGVFAFDANAGRWEFSNAGAPTPIVADIATAPSATFVNSDGSVSRSTDGGSTWQNVTSVVMNRSVSSLATSPAAPSRVYASVNPGDFSAYGGVWISNDLGATWTQSAASSGSNLALVRASRSNANRLFAAGAPDPDTGVAKLFRSNDGGVSFTGPVAETGGAPGFNVQFVDLAEDPFNANHIIAVAAPVVGFSFKGLYGEIWTSTDAGQTFDRTTNNFLLPPDFANAEPRSVLFDRFTQGVVYYATTWGVFKSINGAAPVLASSGLFRLGVRPSGVQPYDEITWLAQDGDANHTLYAASISNGVYRSSDGAANWSGIGTGYTGLDFRMFAFQPGGTHVVLAGAADPSVSNGVYRSTDDGLTWTRSSSGLDSANIRGIAFAPAPNTNVVIAAGFPQQSVAGAQSRGVWRSTDSGQSWTVVDDAGVRNNSPQRIVVFDPANANRVLIASGGAMTVSVDGGFTWVNSVDSFAQFGGLPTQVVGNSATLLGIAAGPGPVSGTRFYASFDGGPYPAVRPPGAEGGVYYSDDGGFHWTAGSGLPDDMASYFSVSPTPGTLYVGKPINGTARSGGVYKSTNYGQTWSDASGNILCRDVFTVAADPTDANVVWTACRRSDITQPGGIFRSNDGGATWVPYGRGLRIASILWLSIDPADANHVLAGGLEGIHEIRFAPDADLDGIPDSEEAQFASGDANDDGTPDASQSYVASVASGSTSPDGPVRPHAPQAADYVVVEIDRNAAFLGACEFVSDLQVIGTDLIPESNRMVQAAPTIRFTLPNCVAAQVKVRYSNLTTYPVGVFGSYSPLTPGDASSTRWGLLDAATTAVDGNGTWTITLGDSAYGNVYVPGSGSIQFQGAPGRDAIFTGTFE